MNKWKGIALESQGRVEEQQREIQRSYEIIRGLEEENAAMREALEYISDVCLDKRCLKAANDVLSTLSKEDTP